MLFFLEVYKKSPAGSPVGDFCLNGAEAVHGPQGQHRLAQDVAGVDGAQLVVTAALLKLG